MIFGINVDPTNATGAPDPLLLKTIGFRAVRLVSHPDREEYARSCHSAGLFVLAIVTFASEGYVMENADGIQVGNEMDCISKSSDTLDAAGFGDMWVRVRAKERMRWRSRPLILGALASGVSSHLGEYIQDDCSGIAVHPYAKTPEEARALLREYRAISKKPLWVTEWNRPHSEIGPFLRMMAEGGVEAAFWFCWSNGMVEGFGLEDKLELLEEAMYIEERLAQFEQQLKDNGSWDAHQDRQIAYFAEILRALLEGDYAWGKALMLSLSPGMSDLKLREPLFPNS